MQPSGGIPGALVRLWRLRAVRLAVTGLAWVVVLAALGIGVAYGVRTDRLALLAGGAAGAVIILVALRWPLAPLFLFAALVPIEDMLTLGPLGTLSKLAAALFVVMYAMPRVGRLRLRAMPVAGWAFMAWAILSANWALDVDVAVAALTTLLQLFFVAVLVADVVADRPEVVRPLLWLYSLSAAFSACLAIFSYLISGASSLSRVGAFEGQGQDPAQFAAILLPALVFAFYELVHGRYAVVAFGVAATTSIGIIVSGTRGAWLAIGVVLIVFLLPRLSQTRRILAVAAAGGLVLVALQLPGVGDLVTQRTEIAVSTGGAGRTTIWSIGLSMYASQPVAGVGYGNFPVGFLDTQAALSGAATAGVAGPHNIVVGTLGELGTVGLMLLAVFVVPLVVFRGWGPDGPMIQATLASLMTAALFLDVLNRKQVWLVLGIVAGLRYLETRRTGVAAPPPARRLPAPVAVRPLPARSAESST